MPRTTTPTPLPELKSTWARKEEEEGRESLHLPGLFIQKGERGEIWTGLIPVYWVESRLETKV